MDVIPSVSIEGIPEFIILLIVVLTPTFTVILNLRGKDQKRVDDLEEAYKSEIAKLKKEQGAQIEDLKKTHERQINDLRDFYETTVERLQNELSDLEHKYTELLHAVENSDRF